jgi:hypothetical protein
VGVATLGRHALKSTWFASDTPSAYVPIHWETMSAYGEELAPFPVAGYFDLH